MLATKSETPRAHVEEPPPFSRKSLSQRWGVSDRTIDAWVASGKLHAVKIGKFVRIPYAEVMRAESEGIAR